MHLTKPVKVGLRALAVGSLAYLLLKPSTAAAGATAAGGTNTSGATYFLFSITTPYSSNPAVTPQGQANVQAALAAAGFVNIQVQNDPSVTAGNSWVATAMFTGTPPTTVTAASGNLTLSNVQALTGTPPVPQPVSNLVVGSWYQFSVRTSFLQGAPDPTTGVPANQPNVAAYLIAMGFGGPTGGTAASPTLYLTAAADQSSTPDTWNVFATWQGPPNVTPVPTSATDYPPLIFFVPNALPTLMAAAPTAAPPTTMP